VLCRYAEPVPEGTADKEGEEEAEKIVNVLGPDMLKVHTLFD
jgi:hypothetical protein